VWSWQSPDITLYRDPDRGASEVSNAMVVRLSNRGTATARGITGSLRRARFDATGRLLGWSEPVAISNPPVALPSDNECREPRLRGNLAEGCDYVDPDSMLMATQQIEVAWPTAWPSPWQQGTVVEFTFADPQDPQRDGVRALTALGDWRPGPGLTEGWAGRLRVDR
jgi:hypothetical protein